MNAMRRLRPRTIPTVLAVALLAATGTVHAADDFFGNVLKAFGIDAPRPAPPAAVRMAPPVEVGPGMAEPFVPQLKTLLRAELHFVRKVCSPDEAQMKEIIRAGLAGVDVVAKDFAAHQMRNDYQWPDARGLLAKAVERKVIEVMPADVAGRYADEIAAREKARKEAATAMMTAAVDRRLSLTPKQFDEVSAAIGDRFQNEWSRDLQIFLYDDYGPSPDPSAIGQVLSDRQRKVWGTRSDNGRILFDWEQGLGISWGGQVEIGGEFDLDAEAAPAETASAEAGPTPAAGPPADDGINRTHFDPKRRADAIAEEKP